jgi:hypothetical protein
MTEDAVISRYVLKAKAHKANSGAVDETALHSEMAVSASECFGNVHDAHVLCLYRCLTLTC